MKVGKDLRNKIIILLIVMILIQFIFPNYVHAEIIANESFFNPVSNFVGGILAKPLAGIFIALFDAVNLIMGFVAKDINASISQAQDSIDNNLWTKELLYSFYLSPDDIFAGNVTFLDANIFDEEYIWIDSNLNGVQDEGNTIFITNSYIGQIKGGVAKIYVSLRNISAIVLLCLLIYTGIRMLLVVNSPLEFGKWKMYLFDWIKALCLLIFVHVIMIAAFEIGELINDGIQHTFTTAAGNGQQNIVSSIRTLYDEVSMFSGALPYIILLILYGYATYLTIVFFVAYFKRLVWTVLLIVIAPVVCIMYAITPKKGVFGQWLTEYLTNVFVQPFHLIMYTILFSLPISVIAHGGIETFWGTRILSDANLMTYIYALLSISMIRPAEKFFRKLFGISGIANQASFESGKKTIDQIKQAIEKTVKVVEKTAKTVAMIVAAIATGGAAAGAMGAGAGAGAAGAGAGAGAAGAEAGAGAAGAEAGAGAAGAEAGAGAEGMGGTFSARWRLRI